MARHLCSLSDELIDNAFLMRFILRRLQQLLQINGQSIESRSICRSA